MTAHLKRRGRTQRKRRPDHRLPLLRAVCEHSVALVIGRCAPARFGPPTSEAFAVIIEDRDPHAGPRAFDAASLLSVLSAVHGVVVLAGKPEADPYDRTASLLTQGVSTLIVETTGAHGRSWRDFVVTVAPALPVVLIP